MSVLRNTPAAGSWLTGVAGFGPAETAEAEVWFWHHRNQVLLLDHDCYMPGDRRVVSAGQEMEEVAFLE